MAVTLDFAKERTGPAAVLEKAQAVRAAALKKHNEIASDRTLNEPTRAARIKANLEEANGVLAGLRKGWANEVEGERMRLRAALLGDAYGPDRRRAMAQRASEAATAAKSPTDFARAIGAAQALNDEDSLRALSFVAAADPSLRKIIPQGEQKRYAKLDEFEAEYGSDATNTQKLVRSAALSNFMPPATSVG